jgi:hypothetical protein
MHQCFIRSPPSGAGRPFIEIANDQPHRRLCGIGKSVQFSLRELLQQLIPQASEIFRCHGRLGCQRPHFVCNDAKPASRPTGSYRFNGSVQSENCDWAADSRVFISAGIDPLPDFRDDFFDAGSTHEYMLKNRVFV